MSNLPKLTLSATLSHDVDNIVDIVAELRQPNAQDQKVTNSSENQNQASFATTTPTVKRARKLRLNAEDFGDPPNFLSSNSSPFVPKTPGSQRSKQLTDLHVAVQNGDLEQVQRLLNKSPHLCSSQDEHGYTALMCAASYQSEELSVQMVDMIASTQSSIDVEDSDGYTAMHWAAAIGNTTTITNLIEKYGANVNAQAHSTRESPLHRASRFSQCKAIEALAAHGAYVLYNKKGQNPFDVAAFCNSDSSVQQKSRRKKVIKSLYQAYPQYRTMLLTHEECFGHRNNYSLHQEAPQRITAIKNAIVAAEKLNVPRFAMLHIVFMMMALNKLLIFIIRVLECIYSVA